MNNDETHELMDELIEKVGKIFPNAKHGFSNAISVNEHTQSGRLEFSLNQLFLKDTPYLKNLSKQFIHYTNLNSFFNILNTGNIRLYNLNQMNDPGELDNLLYKHSIKIDDKYITLFKRSLHIFSMCEYNLDSKLDDFNMWRLYGENGFGLGLVLELVNEEHEWNDWLLGKVIYEDDKEQEAKICELINIINYYVNERGLKINPPPSILAISLLFHKSKLWSIEDEVRIISPYYYDEYNFYSDNPIRINDRDDIIKFFINRTGQVSSYLELELDHIISRRAAKSIDESLKQNYLKNNLRLKIKKVIVGHNVKDDYYKKLSSFIALYSQKFLGEYIPVERSVHYNYFNRQV